VAEGQWQKVIETRPVLNTLTLPLRNLYTFSGSDHQDYKKLCLVYIANHLGGLVSKEMTCPQNHAISQ